MVRTSGMSAELDYLVVTTPVLADGIALVERAFGRGPRRLGGGA